jgi:REP element-mobilizing transposase RayT
MARPLRIEFPGACYHVVNRGNFRFPVFEDAADRALLLEKLADFSARYHVRVRAYCIMVNHFHCHVQTREANLARFMQSFLTSFSVSYNRRHGTSGHVFQGRYKAFLVEDRSIYSSRVSRYIHLNPAEIPDLRNAPLARRRRAIRDARWSSYGQILGLRRCPRWLDRRAVLAGFPGRTRAEKRKEYARFVELGLTKGLDMWNPVTEAAAQTIIGSDRFIDRMRQAVSDVAEKASVRRECGKQVRLRSWCLLRSVVHAVADEFSVPPVSLLAKWSHANDARQVLLYLAVVHCRGRYTLTSLANRLGRISVSGLAKARQLMVLRLASDDDLRVRVDRIQDALAKGKDSCS